ncbi:hypothetical protein [Actinophytocola sp.]|uniref:hypothetical protein n=1 Tax=Actinophytocola sp. TaxID=1872138 RepID=UPI003D6B8FC6
MSGSYRYLRALESLQELFANYPFRADMSSMLISMDPTGKAAILVQLHSADPMVLAAGIVEWKRTLVDGNTWAWRTPSGKEIHISTTGYTPECGETSIVVMTGPVPHDCYLDFHLDPNTSEVLDDERLYHWLGSEIANNWPFKPTFDAQQVVTTADA